MSLARVSDFRSKRMVPSKCGPDADFAGPAEDHRLAAFRRWLAAVDRHDISAMRRVTRELRQLGVSVVATAPQTGGGVR